MDIVKYSRDNVFQRIKAWYIDETSVTLSDDDFKRKDRLVHIWSLRSDNKYSPNQAIKIIMRDHRVSQATAYRDYSLSMQLFGNLDQVDLAAERLVLAESYWNLYQMALKKGNEESARKSLDSYKSLFDFSDKGPQIDPKKLEASVYKLTLARGTGKILNQMFETGSVDFNSLDYTDAEWNEMDENDEELEDE